MEDGESGAPVIEGEPDITEIDDNVLKDLESKYSGVACPVHGTPPSFEVGEDGAVVERICCEALLQILRELQVAAGERTPDVTGGDEDAERPEEGDEPTGDDIAG
ncbi:MAG: hypothetical protein IT372_21800 [Polyangiaceae bacterium]|nr:hypothetical protein [Polyangiaceae bacterium]